MAIKPQNMIPVVKDRNVQFVSAAGVPLITLGTTTASAVPIVATLDPDNDWEIVEVDFVVASALAAAASPSPVVPVSIGTTARVAQTFTTGQPAYTAVNAAATTYLNASNITCAAQAAGTRISLTTALAAQVLKAGCMLTVTLTAGSNTPTGTGYLAIKLRPLERGTTARGYNTTKRGRQLASGGENAAAQAAS